jgi:hypothetical protein
MQVLATSRNHRKKLPALCEQSICVFLTRNSCEFEIAGTSHAVPPLRSMPAFRFFSSLASISDAAEEKNGRSRSRVPARYLQTFLCRQPSVELPLPFPFGVDKDAQ